MRKTVIGIGVVALIVSVAVVVGLNADVGTGGKGVVAQDASPQEQIPPVRTETGVLDTAPPRAKESFENLVYGMFVPSLEMRENVDFLVTPALLTQEALSENVVLTYTNE